MLWDIIKETEECKYNIEIEIDKNMFSEETEPLITNDQSNGNKSSEKNFSHVSNRHGNNNSILKHSNTEDNHQKQKENSSKDSSQNKNDSMYLSQELDEDNSYKNSGLRQKQNESKLNIPSRIISGPNNSRKRNRQVVSHIGNDVHRISHQLSTMHSTTDSDIPKCNDGSENETNYSSNSMTDIEKPTNFDYEAAYNELKLYDYSIEQTAPELKNNLPLNISIKQKARLFFWMLFHHPSVIIKSWFSNSGYSLQKHVLLFEFRNHYNKQDIITDESSGINKKTSLIDRTGVLITENVQPSNNLGRAKKGKAK